MNPTRKRSDIQGLRALAVVSVVLYHGFQSPLPGGYVGVDIFFVISGYVISKTILREIQIGEFSVATFYRRRVRRIFPALFVMLALVFVASLFALSPRDLEELAKSIISTVFFSSNVYFARHSGYFDDVATMKPLLHTWSLSVEEQFYVVYPLFVYFVHRYRRRLLLPALIIMAAASLVFSVWMVEKNPAQAFFLSPARAFELLLGGMIAVSGSTQKMSQMVRDGLSFLGLMMIFVALFAYNDRTLFPGLFALLPCLGTAIVIWCGITSMTVGGRLLSLPVFVFVGDLSYSLYLWHWPMLVLARHVIGHLDVLTRATCVCAALVASILSFYFVEHPFLEERNSKLPFLRMGLASMLMITAISLVIVHKHGMPGLFSLPARTIFAAADDYNHRRDICHTREGTPIEYDHNCTFGADGVYPDTAVWGDSHGIELAVVLGELLKTKNRSVMEITASSCPPVTNYTFSAEERPFCIGHNSETLNRLIGDRRIHIVVLTAAFEGYRDYEFDKFASGYLNVVNRLRECGKRVVIVYPIPMMDFDPPTVLAVRFRLGLSLSDLGIDEREYAKKNRAAIQFLDAIPNSSSVIKIHPEEVFCNEGVCRVFNRTNGVLYYNSSHLSLTGARVLAQTFAL